MPSLTPEEQKRLLDPMKEALKCSKCGQVPTRKYCKGCNEFFFVCNCPIETGSRNDHRGHRTY